MEEILVRTSERTTFTKCRQAWQWSYNDLLVPKHISRALGLGSLVHEALAAFYTPGSKRGLHPARTFRKLCLKAFAEDELDRVDFDAMLDLGVAMLDHYYDTYGNDGRYEIIAPEQPFQLDVHDKAEKYLFTYVGTVDAVIRDLHTGHLGLFEHKTSSTTAPFGAPLALDEQAGSYWAYGPDWLRGKGILAPDEELDFILYNFLRKAKPDTRPVNAVGQSLNKNGTVSKNQPAPYFRRELVYRGAPERANIMRRVAAEVREMRLVREGKLAVYKNPDRHCHWCPHRTMCEVHETGSDWKAIRDSQYTKGDPYAAHLTEEEEEE